MLRCRDNSLYCGVTTDLDRRVLEHNAKDARSAKYTRSRTPVTLVYFEPYHTKQEAMKREYEVKQWKKERKEDLIAVLFLLLYTIGLCQTNGLKEDMY